uniref:GLOBIN domain-containing protein n=1 Tax=Elaeophora elaphi TaxID=1147741 RepID=A0A0R3RNG4_9BILA
MYRSLYWNKVFDDNDNEQQPQMLEVNQNETSDLLFIEVNKFSSQDRKLLYETFKLFEKDLESNGLRIFLETISENPDYKFFWPQFRAIPDSSLISSSVLRKFACTYMNALKKIVESLNSNQVPYEVLQRISIKHARHNIQMHHIQVGCHLVTCNNQSVSNFRSTEMYLQFFCKI